MLSSCRNLYGRSLCPCPLNTRTSVGTAIAHRPCSAVASPCLQRAWHVDGAPCVAATSTGLPTPRITGRRVLVGPAAAHGPKLHARVRWSMLLLTLHNGVPRLQLPDPEPIHPRFGGIRRGVRTCIVPMCAARRANHVPRCPSPGPFPRRPMCCQPDARCSRRLHNNAITAIPAGLFDFTTALNTLYGLSRSATPHVTPACWDIPRRVGHVIHAAGLTDALQLLPASPPPTASICSRGSAISGPNMPPGPIAVAACPSPMCRPVHLCLAACARGPHACVAGGSLTTGSSRCPSSFSPRPST